MLNVKRDPMNNTLEDWLNHMKRIDWEIDSMESTEKQPETECSLGKQHTLYDISEAAGPVDETDMLSEAVPADIPTNDVPNAKEDAENDYLVNELQQENATAIISRLGLKN